MRSTGGSGVGGGGGLARAISKRLQRFAIEFGQRSRLAQGLIVVSACLFVTIVCYSYGIATGDTRSAAHGAWTAVVDRAAHQPSSTVTVAHDRCVLVTTSEGDALCAPHFFILGAFKAGTTSLYRWLSLHPGVAVLNETRSGADHDPEHSTPSPRGGVTNIVRIKETNFFAGYNRTVTGNRGGGGSRRQFATGAEYEMARLQGRNLTAEIERALRHAPKSLADYVAIYFPTLHPEDNQITGEASPAYLFDPRVPYKLAHTFPKARLIALLRDPIERSFSRWNHLVGLRCHIKAGTGAGSVAPEFDPYLCSAAGISALFDRVVRSQLPHLKRCLIESGLTPQPIAATGGFIAPAFSQSAYESLTTCMHRANALLVTGQLQRLESAAALQAQSTVPTAPADADDDSPPPPTVDVNALTQVVRDVLFTRSCIELDFLTHSLYLFQLQNWHSYFTREQLLVIISEELFSDGVRVMDGVSRHLGLTPISWESIVESKYNVGGSGAGAAAAAGGGNKRRGGVAGGGGIDFIRERAASRRQSKGEETSAASTATTSKQHPISDATRRLLSEFFHPFNTVLGQYLGYERSPWPGPSASL